MSLFKFAAGETICFLAQNIIYLMQNQPCIQMLMQPLCLFRSAEWSWESRACFRVGFLARLVLLDLVHKNSFYFSSISIFHFWFQIHSWKKNTALIHSIPSLQEEEEEKREGVGREKENKKCSFTGWSFCLWAGFHATAVHLQMLVK